MRKQKKFDTREQIVAQIDKVQLAFKERSENAAQHGRDADHLFAESAKQTNSADAGHLIKQAQHERSLERKYVRQNRRVPKQLQALKNTLAAFDTDIMAF